MMLDVTPASARTLHGYTAGGITGLEYVYTAGTDTEARSPRRYVLLDNQLAEYGENLHLHRPWRGDVYRQPAHGHLDIALVRSGHGRTHRNTRARRYGYGRSPLASCKHSYSHYYGIFDCLQLHAPKLQKKRQSASLSGHKIRHLCGTLLPSASGFRFARLHKKNFVRPHKNISYVPPSKKSGAAQPLGCVAPVYGSMAAYSIAAGMSV